MSAEWNPDQQLAAQEEGWDIFECSDEEHPSFELQAIGAPSDWPHLSYTEPKFVTADGELSDLAAWRHVMTRAWQRSSLHCAALDFLKEHSSAEYEMIVRATGDI
jgi:hypothetical protein